MRSTPRGSFSTSVVLVLALGACAPATPSGTAPRPVTIAASPPSLLGAATPGAGSAMSAASRAWAESTLASLTLRQRVGQLIMPWVSGEYAAIGSPEFEQVRRWVEDDGVGGLILSIGSPLAYVIKLNELQSRARVPLLVASDMENGTGMRLGGIYALPSLLPQGGGTVFPPVMALGATGSEELAFELGRVLGLEARAVGVHLTFGPVLDVNSNPLNPIINTRSFGEDPALVSRLASAYIRGTRSTGLMTTGKHFPGHGDTRTDSHIELPTIPANRARLDSVELRPFRAAVDGGVDAIMTAHIAVTGVEGPDAPPATLSPRFMTSVLRNDLRFGGLLVTDAMTMGGVAKRYGATEPLILALEAGNDILLMPRNVTEAVNTMAAAVESGRVPAARVDASVRRVLEMKARAGLIVGRRVDVEAVNRIVNIPPHAALAWRVAERSIVLARDSAGSVPLRPAVKRILSVTYADESDLLAARVLDRDLRAFGYTVASVRVDNRTTPAEYATLGARADSVDAVLVSAYVYPRDHRGSVATEGGFAPFVSGLASRAQPVIAISFGSPYLVSAFPSVRAYILAWGGAPVSQSTVAAALAGYGDITGHLPVSIPPYHQIGDGIQRSHTRERAAAREP